ncbi:MAG: branched-chain amino acid transport system II carrier protein [Aerococcus sp.]|nr:branched-chain amino acid transport system II carrier protein [Aerococcus sp.]
MKKKDIFIIGLMLFAMFFGAGNLIFPVSIGFESGPHYIATMLGFMITGIGLPLLTMIAGSFSANGYPSLLNQISPFFSTIFLVLVYIMIGPFSGIPRTATTSYEMGVVPLIGASSHLSLFLFTAIFFAIVLFLALSPDDLSDAIGKYLTPALLITIGLLIIRSIMIYHTNDHSLASERFMNSSAPTIGFLEGYLTMDSIAAMAFTLVLSSSIRQRGVTTPNAMLSSAVRASLIASVLLGIIYLLLGWIGNYTSVTTIPNEQNAGTYLLVAASKEGFGSLGMIVLGLVVFLACLTTATGLISAVASYFHGLMPKISYRLLAIIITFIAFVLANLGLNQILAISSPILSILYPITITIVLLLLFLRWVNGPKLTIQLAITFVTVVSVPTTLSRLGLPGLQWLAYLPLFELQLEWLPFMLAGAVIGFLFGSRKKQLQLN